MSEKIANIDNDQAQEDVISNCLNCSQLLSQNYCAYCGEAAHVHRSLGAIWHDFLHGVLHFDGKFWRTLPMLMFKPGVLTREYISGKRAQYISPMALFLFSIFMMFAVFSFIGGPNLSDINDNNENSFEEFRERGNQALEEQIAFVKREIANGKLVDDEGANNDEKLKGLETALSIVNSGIDDNIEKLDQSDGEIIPEDASIIQNDGSIIYTEGMDEWADKNGGFARKLVDGIKLTNENTALSLYKMKANGYKFSWLLIPLSLPFVWLAMIGVRGHYIYDHAIFTIYSISFMSILFIILAILGSIGVSLGWLVPAGSVIPIVHLYKQIRYAYQLSRRQTILRLIILCIGIVFSLLIFFAILLLLGILG